MVQWKSFEMGKVLSDALGIKYVHVLCVRCTRQRRSIIQGNHLFWEALDCWLELDVF